VALVVAALAPLLGRFLHVGVAGPLWLAAGLLPLAVLSAVLGVLQGREHFGALALAVVVQGLAKLLALVPLAFGGGPASVLAGFSAGTAVAAGLGLLLLRPGPRGAAPALPPARELLLAGGALLALLALANLDLLLARHALPRTESGRYAVGSVLSKAAFWLPQTVAVVVLPRLTDVSAGREVLRRAVLVVAGLGVLEVLGCLLLGGPVVALTFGEQYRSLSGVAPLFVLQGATLAVVQLLVYRGIALHDGTVGRLVVVALAVEGATVLTLQPTTPTGVVLPAVVVALLLAVAGLLSDPGRDLGAGTRG
ncbi:MAG: polysaccharide biosynthesis protein, partial [Frankiales bacterium]|nr:polysaccharide biosynthesis protein [Frankiales bacterium]